MKAILKAIRNQAPAVWFVANIYLALWNCFYLEMITAQKFDIESTIKYALVRRSYLQQKFLRQVADTIRKEMERAVDNEPTPEEGKIRL